MSRRRRRGPPRCQWCGSQIAWWRLDGRWVPFEPTPLTGRDGIACDATPVWGNRSWQYHDLLIELVERQHRTQDEASDEAMAVDWFTRHRCAQRAAAIQAQEART